MNGLMLGLSLLVAPADSTYSPRQFVQQLMTAHPLVENADFLVREREAQLLFSKGMLEPSVSLGYDRKRYDGKNYWNLLDAGVKVPLWPGVDLYGDFQQYSGNFLNAERNVPTQGLYALGVSIPIGRDLWLSPARYSIKTARYRLESARARRTQNLNELYRLGMNAYWDWCGAYEVFKINEAAEKISYEQLQQVKTSALLGDRALIDTLESFIQWQNRQVTLRESEIELINKQQKLLNHIWVDSIKLKISAGDLIPESLDNDAYMPELLNDSLKSAEQHVAEHPIITDMNFQREQLEFEERFRKNQLLPDLKFKYNLLGGVNDQFVAAQTLGTDFYKAGISFEMPIFLRKERAQLQLNRIKQKQLSNSIRVAERQLETGLKASFYEYKLRVTNVQQARSLATNYRKMLEAEIIRFQNGESSVFLLNQRENMLFNAQRKQVDIEVKWRRSLMDYHLQKGDLLLYLSVL